MTAAEPNPNCFTVQVVAAEQRRGGYLLRGRTSTPQSPQLKPVVARSSVDAPPAAGSTAAGPQLHRPLAILVTQHPADHLQRLSEMFPSGGHGEQQDALTFVSTIRDQAAGIAMFAHG